MNIKNKKLFIFDKDGTLTPSKSPMDLEMVELLIELLAHKKIAIITGSTFPLLETQILSKIPSNTRNLNNLYILPNTGTCLYIWNGKWDEQYSENLTTEEKDKIKNVLYDALNKVSFEKPKKIFGEQIEDRGSQITYSALGQDAPLDLKEVWDTTKEKRKELVALIGNKISEFDMGIGGTTSIDITRKGINKAYGTKKLEKFLKISASEIIFIGDALFPGGNDYSVKGIGIDCIQVSGVDETKKLIREWAT